MARSTTRRSSTVETSTAATQDTLRAIQRVLTTAHKKNAARREQLQSRLWALWEKLQRQYSEENEEGGGEEREEEEKGRVANKNENNNEDEIQGQDHDQDQDQDQDQDVLRHQKEAAGLSQGNGDGDKAEPSPPLPFAVWVRQQLPDSDLVELVAMIRNVDGDQAPARWSLLSDRYPEQLPNPLLVFLYFQDDLDNSRKAFTIMTKDAPSSTDFTELYCNIVRNRRRRLSSTRSEKQKFKLQDVETAVAAMRGPKPSVDLGDSRERRASFLLSCCSFEPILRLPRILLTTPVLSSHMKITHCRQETQHLPLAK